MHRASTVAVRRGGWRAARCCLPGSAASSGRLCLGRVESALLRGMSSNRPSGEGHIDLSFQVDVGGLSQGLAALSAPQFGARVSPEDVASELPVELPEDGLGEAATMQRLAPLMLGGAQQLGSPTSFAHMDPPTPWLTWVMALWNASLNQNLLHPDVAPMAREAEALTVSWLAPAFGMDGGHLTGGSTLANMTALWAARELRGVRRVVACDSAHLSVAKSAHVLGLEFIAVSLDNDGGDLTARALAQCGVGDLADAALVLTAGTTSAGAIDDLTLAKSAGAAWCHVDAAWAGPLRLSSRHRALLDGIEIADSVAVSPHKWLWQPKDCGLVLFRDTAKAHAALSSFGGAYIAAPNVGLAGSRGAAAVPLLATLLAFGREGVARRLDAGMAASQELARLLDADSRVILHALPRTGVVLWRPASDGVRPMTTAEVLGRLPAGMASGTTVGGVKWVRHVAANPNASIKKIWSAIDTALA